eukprot:jgi/Chrzof1/3290/Cz12g19210.t1
MGAIDVIRKLVEATHVDADSDGRPDRVTEEQEQERQKSRFECCVVGDPTLERQGSCALSLGTSLYLLERGVPVTISQYIDEALLDDPWVCRVCVDDVDVPLLHDIDAEEWVCGSERIWDYLDQHKGDWQHAGARSTGRPSGHLSVSLDLGVLAPAPNADKLFYSLIGDINSITSSADDQLQAHKDLSYVLAKIEAHLCGLGQPFLGGHEPNATDCYLAAKLENARVAMQHVLGPVCTDTVCLAPAAEESSTSNATHQQPGLSAGPAESAEGASSSHVNDKDAWAVLPELRAYLQRWKDRSSWQQCQVDDEVIRQYWQQKRDKARKQGMD